MFAKLFKLILWAFAIIGVGVIIVAVGAIAFLSYRLPAAKSPPQNIVLSINFKQELHEQDNTMPRSLRAVYNHLQQTDEDEALSLRDEIGRAHV